ncbi:MAG: cytochrome C [Planctomycetia bacterium]|nr:cytochrome C [Planctomycetia bacterium]
MRFHSCWPVAALLWMTVACAAAPAADATPPLVTFTTRTLDRTFVAEGAAVGDVNRDGKPDVVAGPWWYAGPDFATRHEYMPPKPFDPAGYSDNFFAWVRDVSGDGWNDIVVFGFPGQDASWFENPGDTAAGHWKKHVAVAELDNESPTFADLTGDGIPEIVGSIGGFFGYATPGADPRAPWTFHRISPQVAGGKFTHGLGVGDVDGDGRPDILDKNGWWRQPESLTGDPAWERHEVAFSRPGGAQMLVTDVDGDGLNDVVTSLAAHGYGLAWYRQEQDAAGTRSFSVRPITGDKPSDNPFRVAFSQIHALALADIDGDGQDDIVTGKRWWAHGAKGDPEPDAPAVVYWFRGTRGADGPEFVPHLIHDDSGVGVQVTVGDASGDGVADVVVSNKKGTFVHTVARQTVARADWEAAQPRRRRPLANGLAAAEAAAAMSAPPGFQVTLLAAEPDVRQPIAMCFDDRGRLWVAEAYAYPKRVPAAEARDRILIFEDTDGDQRLDSRTVFREGLNLVSGLQVGFGGVWVGAAPELLFIPDRDGDDRPDGEPQVLLDGWGYEDTHETLNAFIWGPDGWLYGCHGVFTHSNVGKPGAPDGERKRINAGIWRYHPTRHQFEVFSEGTSNPWGVDFNDLGHAFQTACVIPHLYHVIPGARYQRQAGQHFNPHTYDDIKTIARHRHWTGGQWNNADRDKSDAIGGGHAHCGAMVYLGGAWPERYRGKLFMNNIHGARLNQDRLEPAGSGYVGDGDPDFLFANDAWSQFISLQTGPDGQMVLIDWYDAQQCHHNEFGKHDRENGRIFKVSYGTPQPVRVDLGKLPDRELVAHLAHDNDWFVRHARRILQERAAAGRLDPGTGAALQAALAAAPTAPKRLRVVWAMHVTGLLDAAGLERLLADPEPAVRGWAVRLASQRDDIPVDVLVASGEQLALHDPSPVVRLELCSALLRLPPAARWPVVEALVTHGEDATDHNLPLMEWYCIEPLVPLDPPRALALAARSKIPTVSRFIVRRAAGEEACYEALVAGLARAPSADRRWMLDEIVAALAARGRMPMPQAWTAGYDALRGDADADVRRLADLVAVRFGDERVLPGLRAVLADRKAATERRGEALEALAAARDPATAPVLHTLLDDPALGTRAVSSLAAVPDDRTPAAVLGAYARLPAEAQRAAVATLVSRPAWTVALLDAIAAGTVPRGDLSAFTVQQLAGSADPAVLAKLNAVWGTIRATPADRQAEFATWRKALAHKALEQADLSHGREVFAKTCGTCHALHGTGAKIGPELTGSNRGDLEYLLANLLDPSSIVGRDYQMTTVLTTDGRSIAGIVVRESPEAITLQTPTEQVTVPVADIDSRVLSPLSLMPENQLAQLPKASAVALVAYLRHPTQVPLPGAGPPPFTAEGRIPGALEGEKLAVKSKTAGDVRPQAMGSFTAGRWSGNSQLWWTGAKAGDRLVLEVPVTTTGPHEIRAVCTKAHDYAIVSLEWNDAPASAPLDLYHKEGVVHTTEVPIATVDLAPGTATLTVEIVGENPGATHGWMFGLDYLRLVPVKAP